MSDVRPELGPRKAAVLRAVVEEYVRPGEPVGSETIAEGSKLGVSSATIRNELAALEELGYLSHPHTSAGRIPTDLGYRFFIESLMAEPGLGADERLLEPQREEFPQLVVPAWIPPRAKESLSDYAARMAETVKPSRDAPLILGGVEIPHPRGLAGHSDADALLHAIIDALLGAAALGDIGGMFPSSDEQWRGAAGADLLRLVRERVSATGLQIVNIDATVIAQEPRLGGYIGAMRDVIAATLEVDVTAVSVKATTSDGLGFTGRGDGIAALAVVLLE